MGGTSSPRPKTPARTSTTPGFSSGGFVASLTLARAELRAASAAPAPSPTPQSPQGARAFDSPPEPGTRPLRAASPAAPRKSPRRPPPSPAPWAPRSGTHPATAQPETDPATSSRPAARFVGGARGPRLPLSCFRCGEFKLLRSVP
ncbi:PREDICTED: small integral membrane protein 15 isoform X1 [Chinchilla lanigera]|uniref:small integral membrane protein 15 isoform X1 n=1 Tax=Chinchilla lanigera TaxID=34839 RepID=UPI00038ED4E7|nr:PREDICTED: small integral membrane protein 15 isoform X1 [Chinchilla lanigera]